MLPSAFDDAVNELSDQDWAWWPFLWVRPEKHARMSMVRVATMAILFGVPSGALASIVFAVAMRSTWTTVPTGMLCFPLTLFLFGYLVVARAWNRRSLRVAARRRLQGDTDPRAALPPPGESRSPSVLPDGDA